tara:strand:+ start:886 stop:2586 length:1701 start_codon:yes stop_codon:yes gene_type:complete
MKNTILSLFLSILSFTLLNAEENKNLGEVLDPKVDNHDYTSKVPQFKFSNTLKEQEEELKNNPLLLRFKESRKKLASDPHLPLYHFVSPENRLNDPNGLSYWQGNWHLFYQAYPPEDPRQHWGHAISKDLINWEDLPYAIYPNPEYQCFSGSALVEEDRVIAMYHGTRIGNMVATSSDPLLLNWEKVGNKAVIPMTPNSDDLPYDVYDPNIWKKDGVYYSISGGLTREQFGEQYLAGYLFKSTDLENWEYMHQFVENDRFTGLMNDLACPYFWPIGDRWILPFYSHKSGGQYFVGDYDKKRDKFIPTNHGKFNFGASRPGGVHAPSAAPDGKGGVIIMFNMNDGKPTEGWNQIMSLPRLLSLENGDTLKQTPAGGIESLRYDHEKVDPMTLPANKEVVLRSINGNAMEIIAEIDPKDSPMVELNVLRNPNKKEFTRIAFYKNRGMHIGRNYKRPRPKSSGSRVSILGRNYRLKNSLISIESSFSSILPDVLSRGPETGAFLLEPDETLKLRIFIDKSVVEVFANDRQAVAMRVYPGLKRSTGVSIRAQGSEAELISLDAWQMKSIY